MASNSRRIARYALVVGSSSLLGYGTYKIFTHNSKPLQAESAPLKTLTKKALPTRKEQLDALRNTQFDVLVIGGGASGCGIALDAQTRGLKTALVELDDFSSGTSSRSTKLIHGGVRYLQKAIFNLDYDQYKMVREALHERANLIEVAPHLAYPLPIMLPVYQWYKVPYFWAGIKAYDLVAGRQNLRSSYYLSKTKALELFPMLQKDKLCGAIVYYDGQHNDARMCVTLAITAARYGAAIANHVEVTGLLRDENGKLRGAKVRDNLTKSEFEIKAKSVVNATGPFTDSIRQMDNSKTPEICVPSQGVHIVLPGYYSPESMGLLDPNTSDGRVIFFLPWEGFTIAGTTDKLCEVTHHPAPTEVDIQFILREIKKYLNADVNVRRGDVLSAWAGIRPLVRDPSKTGTEGIARNHIIDTSPSGLVTIAGGKWTTYREMAEQTVDTLLKNDTSLAAARPVCQTKGLLLEGAEKFSPTMYISLVQNYGLEPDVAKHLAHTYGDRAFAVAKLAEITGKRWPVLGQRLHSEFPYIQAEVRFAAREYAATAVDVIARRMRLAFLHTQVAEEVLSKVVDILGQELNWDSKEKKAQTQQALEFLRVEMGTDKTELLRAEQPMVLTKEEINSHVKKFNSIDKTKRGYITVNDLRKAIKVRFSSRCSD